MNELKKAELSSAAKAKILRAMNDEYEAVGRRKKAFPFIAAAAACAIICIGISAANALNEQKDEIEAVTEATDVIIHETAPAESFPDNEKFSRGRVSDINGTDIKLWYEPSENSAYLFRDTDSGRQWTKLPFYPEEMPFEYYFHDITGDGTDDLIMIFHPTGANAEDELIIADGITLKLIPVDNEIYERRNSMIVTAQTHDGPVIETTDERIGTDLNDGRFRGCSYSFEENTLTFTAYAALAQGEYYTVSYEAVSRLYYDNGTIKAGEFSVSEVLGQNEICLSFMHNYYSALFGSSHRSSALVLISDPDMREYVSAKLRYLRREVNGEFADNISIEPNDIHFEYDAEKDCMKGKISAELTLFRGDHSETRDEEMYFEYVYSYGSYSITRVYECGYENFGIDRFALHVGDEDNINITLLTEDTTEYTSSVTDVRMFSMSMMSNPSRYGLHLKNADVPLLNDYQAEYDSWESTVPAVILDEYSWESAEHSYRLYIMGGSVYRDKDSNELRAKQLSFVLNADGDENHDPMYLVNSGVIKYYVPDELQSDILTYADDENVLAVRYNGKLWLWCINENGAEPFRSIRTKAEAYAIDVSEFQDTELSELLSMFSFDFKDGTLSSPYFINN